MSETPKTPTSKIIQMMGNTQSNNGYIVLCEDGSIWETYTFFDEEKVIRQWIQQIEPFKKAYNGVGKTFNQQDTAADAPHFVGDFVQ